MVIKCKQNIYYPKRLKLKHEIRFSEFWKAWSNLILSNNNGLTGPVYASPDIFETAYFFYTVMPRINERIHWMQVDARTMCIKKIYGLIKCYKQFIPALEWSVNALRLLLGNRSALSNKF